MQSLLPTKSTGQAEKTLNHGRNVKRIFDSFLKHDDVQELLPPRPRGVRTWTWDALPCSTLIQRPLYELFATYLSDLHVNPQAENGKLKDKQVLSYLNKSLALGKAKHRESGGAEAILFFSCIDTKSTSEQAEWLYGLRSNLLLKIGKRDGFPVDDSSIKAPALTLDVLAQCTQSHMAEGTPEAANRNAALQAVKCAVLRPGEPGEIDLNRNVSVNSLTTLAVADVWQSKGGKFKMAVFSEGIDRHNSFILCLADYLVLGKDGKLMKDNDEEEGPQWLFPFLRGNANACAEKIGSFVKALLPAPNGATNLTCSAVSDLPVQVKGKSIRVGTCDLLSCTVPVEHGVSLSGHDLKNISSFYEYQRTHIGRFTAGAAVLAGYPAPPWGSTGFGPKCVDVAALRVCGVDLRDEDTKMAFVHLILDLFRLDSASPPALLPSGEFMKPVVEGQLEGGWWPLVVSSFGSVVMYRPERIAANPVEMREVQLALVKAVQRSTFGGAARPGSSPSSPLQAEEVLRQWAGVLREKFATDNLPLTSRCGIGGDGAGVNQIVGAIEKVSDALNIVGRTVSKLQASLNRRLEVLEREVHMHMLRAHP